MTTPEDSSVNDTKRTITFRHKESNFHRVIYVDGVLGAISPAGQAHLSLYNSRQPIPDELAYSTAPDSDTVLELESKLDHGLDKEIHREIEISIVMNPPAVMELYNLLKEVMEGLARREGEGDSKVQSPEASNES